MNEILLSLNEVNQKFNSFWNDYKQIPIYYSEVSLDFEKPETKNLSHLILVYPFVTQTNRASLGDSHLQRTGFIYTLKLYTNKELGNIEHQKVGAKLIEFFSKLRFNNSFPLSGADVSVPAVLPEVPNFIVTNYSVELFSDAEV